MLAEMELELEQSSPAPRRNIIYACEACRASKVRCQPGPQQGICRRCLDSKRECIFSTGPRTRRPRQRFNQHQARPPPRSPPPGPSKTFTIDIPIPADAAGDDDDDDYAALAERHELMMEGFLPPASADAAFSTASPSASQLSSASSSSHRRGGGGAAAAATPVRLAAQAFAQQPQFNLASAEALLGSFRGMLRNFPCLALARLVDAGEEVTVGNLARRRPFVLLAVLAVAAAVRGGRSLYDEEFRKMLGLKYVAGGERSLEMLQGLVVYCSWFPFHVRPNVRQAHQYVRMAVDMVHDLELDQPPAGFDPSQSPPSEEQLEHIRSYIAAYIFVSNFTTSWSKKGLLPYTPWTIIAISTLLDSPHPPDAHLAWLLRLQHLVTEADALYKPPTPSAPFRSPSSAHPPHHVDLLLRGLHSQLAEYQTSLSSSYTQQDHPLCLRLLQLFTPLHLRALPLVQMTVPPHPTTRLGPPLDPADLRACVPPLASFFAALHALPAHELTALPVLGWGRVVMAVMLGVRLCLPHPGLPPSWDPGWARGALGFGAVLARLEVLGLGPGEDGPRGGGGGRGGGGVGGMAEVTAGAAAAAAAQKRVDILGAFRVVVGVMRKKYEGRVAMLTPASVELADLGGGGGGAGSNFSSRKFGCPMIDGSMDEYLDSWNEAPILVPPFGPALGSDAMSGLGSEGGGSGFGSDFGQGMMQGRSDAVSQQQVFHDLWATMTMSWAAEGMDPDLGSLQAP